MSRFVSTIQHRRIQSRNRRQWQRLIVGVGSPSMREELIVMSQRSLGGVTR